MEAYEDTPDRNSLVVFGVDVGRVECFRKSMLNGACGAMVGGLATVFYTSNTSKAAKGMFASFWITAFSYWFVCRYQKYKRGKVWDDVKLKQKAKPELSEDSYVVLPSSNYRAPGDASEEKSQERDADAKKSS